MATLEYIDIPVGAIRLRGIDINGKKGRVSNDIRPATKIMTGLPNPSPPPSPTSSKRRGSSSSTGSALSSPSPAISLLPQLLLSSSLPPSSLNPASTSSSNTTPTTGSSSTLQSSRKNNHSFMLLSSRDPISIPVMTTNFKRFVSVIGPVFWLQDRIEEIILWKRGWLRTTVWMASYAFLCFYPRLILLLPQVIMIGIILATYPYPQTSLSSPDPVFYSVDNTPSSSVPPTEDSIPWQSNIQGIQNLMGATADLFALMEPFTYHLHLHPSHLTSPAPNHSRTFSKSSSSSTAYSTSRPPSPYTPHILTLLVVSFPFLAFIISLPSFPIRGVCLVGGLLPFFLTHPWTRTVGVFVLKALIIQGLPIARKRMEELTLKVRLFYRDFPMKLWHAKTWREEKESEEGYSSRIGENIPDVHPIISFKTFLQRLIDDDRLIDSCWNSEMREVELWENERFGGSDPAPHSTSPTGQSASIPASASAPTFSIPISSSSSSLPQKGWSKQNLKNGERSAWTRGRDGWSPVVGSNASNEGGAKTGGKGSGMVEGTGEISSNLTFSLAPGWAFVETEDWRKDLGCQWSGYGGDQDGWVYTNDAWLGPRPMPYASGGGSVTRRRRWVRRVWFDEERYKRDR